MADTFRAVLIEKTDDARRVSVTDLPTAELMDGAVTIAVDYSTVNYKDGLALTDASPAERGVRRYAEAGLR